MLDAAYLYNKHGAPLDYDLWKNLRKILDWLSENWREPDEGIWEVSGRRQFVSSKLLELGGPGAGGQNRPPARTASGDGRWMAERDAIYEEVMEKGWNPRRRASYSITARRPRRLAAHDAAGQVRRPHGPRVGSPPWTASSRNWPATRSQKRYRPEDAAPDGLAGDEGSFNLCSFWLVECLTQAGRLEEARLALEKMFSYANHLGLYGGTGVLGEALGNFLQASTHLALISAAVHLDRALGAR